MNIYNNIFLNWNWIISFNILDIFSQFASLLVYFELLLPNN